MRYLDQRDQAVVYPLAHPQKRIWYVENIYPHTSLHNIGGPVRIEGPLDFVKLEEAIHLFIRSHDGIRLTFIEHAGEVKQYVNEAEQAPLDFMDFSNEENPREAFDTWVHTEACKPFALLGGQLFYFALFTLSGQDNGFFVKLHHIIADGWSTYMLTDQIWDTYIKLLNHELIQPEPFPGYPEYILQENTYILSRRAGQDRAFWMDRFSSLPEPFATKRSNGNRGQRRTFELPFQLSESIKTFSSEHSYSLNTYFIALYFLYLNKITGQTDTVIGTPVFNRSGARQKSTFGMFTSTMPFRFTTEGQFTFFEMLSRIQGELFLCYKHHKYPYNLLVQDLHLNRDGHNSLFDFCVNYYNTRHNTRVNGLPVTNTEFYNGQQLYSMQWIIRDWSDTGCLLLDIDYQVEEYTAEQIEQMYVHLLQLLRLVLANPDKAIQELSLLSSAEEKWQLYEFNHSAADYPRHLTISQLFDKQVQSTPNHVAISCEEESLTYRELNDKANSLAILLNRRGEGRNSIIGVYMTHSIETIVGILGIFKAGGAYLPLDPSSPVGRIEYMLKDAGVKLLLTNRSNTPPFQGDTIRLDQTSLHERKTVLPEDLNHPSDMAYVIYTSGSTGKPKGTMIGQQALVNYISWACKMYVSHEREVFPLYSSLAFDLTVTSLFTPLLSGGQIVVYRDDEDEHVLYRILRENKATVLKLTPSHLALLKDRDYRMSSIRRLIVGGEDFKTDLAASMYAAWGGRVEIINEYGPTETTVGCMHHSYNAEKDTEVSVPIGRPADNVQIYVLDSQLRLVPPGCTGEIYISGDGLALGYLNRSDMTRERFLPHPYKLGATIYKTGDLGRFREDGVLEYKNRADTQLSIRGYRIEPGEIENCLLAHPAIREALIVRRQDNHQSSYVCAYIVCRHEVSEATLKQYLAISLPPYMIPLHIVTLAEIPLTSNGKVDSALLPEPPTLDLAVSREMDGTRRSQEESALIETIGEVMKLEKIGRNDNFYQLGGDSIKAIQIVSAMKAEGYTITVNDILSHPLIGEMAVYVRSCESSTADNLIVEGRIHKTPITSWFFACQMSRPQGYHQSVMLEVTKPMLRETLEKIMLQLILHHDALRMNLHREKQELFYNSHHLSEPFNILEYDLSHLSPEQQRADIERVAGEMRAGMCLYTDLLIQACVFVLANEKRHLFITAHHLLVDGVSWRILLEDLNRMAWQIQADSGVKMAAKTLSYQQWAETLNQHAHLVKEREQSYWEHMLNSNFQFPPSMNHTAVSSEEAHQSLMIRLTEEETYQLMTNANTAYATRPLELMLTALLLTIKEHTSSSDIVIDLEGHGRDGLEEAVDVSRTIGWFTSLYPFRIQLEEQDVSLHIKQVKEHIRKIPASGIGFGILKYLTGSVPDNHARPLIFNYLGEFRGASTDDWFTWAHNLGAIESSRGQSAIYGIEINGAVIHQELHLSLSYCTKKFSRTDMDGFMVSFRTQLTGIISYCCQAERTEFTPSDFDAVELSQAELDSLFS